ncbi:MAG: M42 family peptidase [Thermoleophilia bacterium]|nr:M42 family peptidase [Thermoleophilia bacterium]
MFAHADQIGMVIRGAGDDGLLKVASLASWRAQDAHGQRVRIMTAAGEVRGVVVAPHEGEITWQALRIDIGALDRESALQLVRPGDGVALVGPPEELPNGCVLSGALDDRVGVFACLETLRRVAADPPDWDVAVVVSVQEETGTHGGARTVAERLAPDVAIAVDVTYAGDAPGTAPWGDVRLGGGPSVFRGPIVSPVVGDGLLAAGAAAGIELTIESGSTTYSDADDVFSAAGGVATQIVCIPLRYMHTAGEIAQLTDVDATSRLLEAYARSLSAESSFLR